MKDEQFVGAIIGAVIALIVLWVGSAYSAEHIHNNQGGDVLAFHRDFQILHQQKRKVVISGRCDSSCTLGLKYPNVCVLPGAILCFHAARGSHEDYWSNEPNALGTHILGSAVPPELRGRLLPLTNQMKCIPASALPRRYLCH